MVIILILILIGLGIGFLFVGLAIFALIAAAFTRILAKIVAKMFPSPEMEQRVAELDQSWAELKQHAKDNRRR